MIKRAIKLLLALGFLIFEKIFNFFQNANEKPGTCVVLMYHDVLAENYNRFVRQMEKLPKLATPLEAGSIHKLKNGIHHVAVTFDDGFAATIELVIPVLTHKAIPATFFIPTAYLGRRALWSNYINRGKCLGPVISTGSLKLLNNHNGITIGSHGKYHRFLTEMTDHEAFSDLVESKKTLESITNNDVKLYSLPYGVYEDRHITMARKAGYDYVFSVEPTLIVGTVKEFVIGRVEVNPSDWPIEFTLKVLGAYRWHPFVSRLKTCYWDRHSQR